MVDFLSPLISIPIQAIGWVAWGYYERISNLDLEGIWAPLLPFAVYTIVIGYIYIIMINLLFLVFRPKFN
ncbi:hypothetical protein SAMN04515618_11732 [Collimonas sp. OK307]|nr:hypothetical protein SAMN04515618_11732 [Collimonas sp. OK307]